jgi:hypothetical protein
LASADLFHGKLLRAGLASQKIIFVFIHLQSLSCVCENSESTVDFEVFFSVLLREGRVVWSGPSASCLALLSRRCRVLVCSRKQATAARVKALMVTFPSSQHLADIATNSRFVIGFTGIF